MLGVSMTVTVPLPLLVVTRVVQLPAFSVVEDWTVMVLPGKAVMAKVSVPPDQTGLLKLSEPEPLPPIVVNVKEVVELRTAPSVYLGLAFEVPVIFMKPRRELR